MPQPGLISKVKPNKFCQWDQHTWEIYRYSINSDTVERHKCVCLGFWHGAPRTPIIRQFFHYFLLSVEAYISALLLVSWEFLCSPQARHSSEVMGGYHNDPTSVENTVIGPIIFRCLCSWTMEVEIRAEF